MPQMYNNVTQSCKLLKGIYILNTGDSTIVDYARLYLLE